MRRVIYTAAFAILGAAIVLGTVGCVPTGFTGDGSAAVDRRSDNTEGRFIVSNNAGFSFGAGTVTSYVGVLDPWQGGGPELAKKDKVTGNPEASSRGGYVSPARVRGFRITHYTNELGGGFDPGYDFVWIAAPPKSGGIRKPPAFDILLDGINAETTDTSGDGFISGNVGTCGLTSGIGFGYGGVPYVYFQDVTTCTENLAPFTSAMTDFAGNGLAPTEKDWKAYRVILPEFEGFDPFYNNSVMKRLDFGTLSRILSSVNTESDVTKLPAGEHVRLHVTEMSLFGESRAMMVPITLVNMNNLVFDANSGALRELAAWMAERLEQGLDNGATAWQGTVTLNGAATVDVRKFLASNNLVTTKPSMATVDSLRDFAAGSFSRIAAGGDSAGGGRAR
jgi:hypothetical protein